jgi:hypothetical protein
MLYSIIEAFSPSNGDAWDKYCDWRGLRFERFDSIDGLLRPSLFDPKTPDYWRHVYQGDSAFQYLTDKQYAEQKHRDIGQGDLVGLRLIDHDKQHRSFLGFDLLDGYFSVSLLTNWGNDVTFINQALGSNALVSNLQAISSIQTQLFDQHGEDNHVEDCHIVSLYDPKQT